MSLNRHKLQLLIKIHDEYRMKQTLLFVVLCVLLVTTGCQSVKQLDRAQMFDFDSASIEISIKTQQFTESHITGDLIFLNNIFAPDARIYPPNADKIVTADQIADINAQYVEYGIYEFTETSTNMYGGPEIIVDEGTYTMTYGPERISEAGHYINIWKNVDGEWKLYSNTWTVLPTENN